MSRTEDASHAPEHGKSAPPEASGVETQRVYQAPHPYYSPDRVPPRRTSPNMPKHQENWASPVGIGPVLTIANEQAKSRPIRPSHPHSVSLHLPVGSGPVPPEGYPPFRQPIRPSQNTISESGVSPYSECSYGHPYHRPAHCQSFCAQVAYYSQDQACAPYRGIDPINISHDKKQQKRKRTISGVQDMHRKFFAASLQYPYLTEDEKQYLMRQTGLSMGNLIQESYPGGQEESAHRGTIFFSFTRTVEAFTGSISIDLEAPSPRAGYDRPPVLTRDRAIVGPPLLLEPPAPLPKVPDLKEIQFIPERQLAPIRNQPPSQTAIFFFLEFINYRALL
ncbi:uncharacterized protein FMAN_14154 [Fusarium mangiferae]|uniref:Homeobox domain-containing protein n=1 Tax=Fusarium mangiferae TaxID=192010 RepID=A0A1L7UL59_FUSMA|nr:uncharacterized protein FMAN_14154 [Fusarium mangiferae]CVL08211.1 uncharacterized protein FMAN_14154 [Fusarium mangiferae]